MGPVLQAGFSTLIGPEVLLASGHLSCAIKNQHGHPKIQRISCTNRIYYRSLQAIKIPLIGPFRSKDPLGWDARAGSLWHRRAGGAAPHNRPRHRVENSALGFGVCCVVTTSTCGATLSSNITYIRNPGYPSSYTPSSAGTCTFTINKCSDNICQLREGFRIIQKS